MPRSSAQHFYFKGEVKSPQTESHFWKLKVNLLAGEPLVDRAEGLSLVLNVGLLSLVQVNFEEASSIQTDPKIGELKILAVE